MICKRVHVVQSDRVTGSQTGPTVDGNKSRMKLELHAALNESEVGLLSNIRARVESKPAKMAGFFIGALYE